MKTVIGLYDRFEDAQQAVQELRNTGFRSEDISMVARDASGEYSRYFEDQQQGHKEHIADGAAAGAGVGAVVGGLGGLLLGLGALAIPGIGPVLAAGPLVSALAGAGVGAVAGGIVGALVDLGIPEEHAQYYAEGIRRGGTLVIVRADDAAAEQAMTVMNRHNPVDVNRRAQDWRQSNWSGYDPNAQPLSQEQMEFNRQRDRSNIPVTGESHYVDNDVMDRQIPGTQTTPRDQMDRRDREDFDQDQQNRDQSIPNTGGMTSSGTDLPVVEEDVYEEVDYLPDTGFDQMDTVWRSNYQSVYGASGRNFDYYQPAYRFGYDLAGDENYMDYDWNRMEPVARQQWERRGMRGTWEDMKDAVRYAWEQIRH